MAVTTLAEALEALNDTRERLHLETSMAEITATNITNIGVLPPEQINAFMGMLNLVLQERYFKVMFDASDNPFRAFLIDMRKEGFGIRDVMQNIIDGVTPMWDNASDAAIAADLVAYAGDNFEQKYHTKKFQKQFKASVNEREYSKVFTAYGITQYIDNKIANLNTSAEYWLMKTIIDEMKANAQGNKLVIKSGNNLNNAQGIKNTIESIKTVMQGALTPTTLYNKDGIITKAQDSSFLYLVTTPDRLERITTQVLSGTFNMNLLDLNKFKVLLAPVGYDLGTVNGEQVQFFVLDRLSMPVGIRTWEMRTFPVPNTLWTNTWLSIEGIIGENSFMTGVAFTGSFGNFQPEVSIPHVFFGDALAGNHITVGVTIDGVALTGKTDSQIIDNNSGVGAGGGMVNYEDGEGSSKYVAVVGSNTNKHTVNKNVVITTSISGSVQTEEVSYLKIVVLKTDGSIEIETWYGMTDDPETFVYSIDDFISIALVYGGESQG